MNIKIEIGDVVKYIGYYSDAYLVEDKLYKVLNISKGFIEIIDEMGNICGESEDFFEYDIPSNRNEVINKILI